MRRLSPLLFCLAVVSSGCGALASTRAPQGMDVTVDGHYEGKVPAEAQVPVFDAMGPLRERTFVAIMDPEPEAPRIYMRGEVIDPPSGFPELHAP